MKTSVLAVFLLFCALIVLGCGANTSSLHQVSAEGMSFLKSWGNPGSGPGQFNSPTHLAIDSQENIYVVDSGNARIQKFAAGGAFKKKWGSSGTGNGQFIQPFGIAIGPDGSIHVTDSGRDDIQKFARSGAFVKVIGAPGAANGQFNDPQGIAVDTATGYLYVVDRTNSRIQKLKASGGFIKSWGSAGTGSARFSQPVAIALDTAAHVYTTEDGTDRIQKFNLAGGFLNKWGSLGTDSGQFNDPHALCVDTHDNIWVVDTGNNRIQRCKLGGAFREVVGGPGTFEGPSGIAVSPADRIYLTEQLGNRVGKFSRTSRITDSSTSFIMTVGAKTYGSTTGEVYNVNLDRFNELKGRLNYFKPLGINNILFLASYAYGFGGTQRWNTASNPDLSGINYELQRAIRDSKIMSEIRGRGMNIIWVHYLGSYWGPGPGGGDWFVDAGWNNFLTEVHDATVVLHNYGCNGFGFDGEMYGDRFTWDWDYTGNTHTEAEVRAQARVRGAQYMQTFIDVVPNVRVFTFPSEYEKQVRDWFYDQVLPGQVEPSRMVWDEFVAGMLSTNGWGGIYFFPETFYKNTQSLGDWDTALSNWKAQFIAGLSSRTPNWSSVESKVGIAYGAWLDGDPNGVGDYQRPVPPDRAALQLPAMATHGRDYIWIYRQQPLTFDYNPYNTTMRQVAGLE